MKKHLVLIVLVFMMCATILSACAAATGVDSNGNVVTDGKQVKITHIVNSMQYVLDYVEDNEHGYACYVYSDTDAGSIFCFSLEK